MRPAPDLASSRKPLIWIVAAAAVGFAASFLFSSVLRWPRGAFVAAYSAIVVAFAAAYLIRATVSPLVQLERRWRAGVIVGVAAGLLLARAVAMQAGSDSPRGLALGAALLWYGVVYGLVDAILLSVLPVLMVYGSRSASELRAPGGRLKWGAMALLASAVVTTAYHVGFAEFRGREVAQPLIGNTVVTAAYLVSGNPLAAIISHVAMHGAAVIHGMEGTTQLPPHY